MPLFQKLVHRWKLFQGSKLPVSAHQNIFELRIRTSINDSIRASILVEIHVREEIHGQRTAGKQYFHSIMVLELHKINSNQNGKFCLQILHKY